MTTTMTNTIYGLFIDAISYFTKNTEKDSTTFKISDTQFLKISRSETQAFLGMNTNERNNYANLKQTDITGLKTEEEKREKRLQNRIGKYVIVTNTVEGERYMNDKRLDPERKSFWTPFLYDAIVFGNKQRAIDQCARIKSNQPKVALVTNALKVEPIVYAG